jgi:hypothetical protein
VERLDQAEDYVNERLTACGEFWRLDANTRAMLGLPPRANLPNNGSEDDKQSRSKLLRDLGYKK